VLAAIEVQVDEAVGGTAIIGRVGAGPAPQKSLTRR